MTSLSNQLRNLQIPDTLSVLNLQDKRASILFEAHEAADVDVDTIFALGRTGLEELQRIDSDFEKFDKTLFSESFKALERTQQPREFNQRLDKKIEEFLVCLSPYFLIKPSQKALEWLIRRFRIHVFNVNALMCCVLPFHETKLFARVLTIITFNKQTEKWDWLAQVQKSGIPLPKSVLIQHCLSDSSFLAFICEMIPQAIEIKHSKSLDKLKTLCSFYASVLLGVAESSKNLSESMIGKMLPYLYQGLKSNFEDYKVSSYLVLSQMCLMKTFKEQITSSLVDQICKVFTLFNFNLVDMDYFDFKSHQSTTFALLSSSIPYLICGAFTSNFPGNKSISHSFHYDFSRCIKIGGNPFSIQEFSELNVMYIPKHSNSCH